MLIFQSQISIPLTNGFFHVDVFTVVRRTQQHGDATYRYPEKMGLFPEGSRQEEATDKTDSPEG